MDTASSFSKVFCDQFVYCALQSDEYKGQAWAFKAQKNLPMDNEIELEVSSDFDCIYDETPQSSVNVQEYGKLVLSQKHMLKGVVDKANNPAVQNSNPDNNTLKIQKSKAKQSKPKKAKAATNEEPSVNGKIAPKLIADRIWKFTNSEDGKNHFLGILGRRNLEHHFELVYYNFKKVLKNSLPVKNDGTYTLRKKDLDKFFGINNYSSNELYFVCLRNLFSLWYFYDAENAIENSNTLAKNKPEVRKVISKYYKYLLPHLGRTLEEDYY